MFVLKYVLLFMFFISDANLLLFPTPTRSVFAWSLFAVSLCQTGQPMEQLSLVPNLNLRRLIKDLLTEGGEGLYLHRADSDSDGVDDETGVSRGDETGRAAREQGGGGARRERGREEDREYRFALVAEQILVLKVRFTKMLKALTAIGKHACLGFHLFRGETAIWLYGVRS